MDYKGSFIDSNSNEWILLHSSNGLTVYSNLIKIDFPKDETTIYNQNIFNNEIQGYYKTKLYTLHSVTLNGKGYISITGIPVDSPLPSFSYPIPFEIADAIQKLGNGDSTNLLLTRC